MYLLIKALWLLFGGRTVKAGVESGDQQGGSCWDGSGWEVVVA